MLNSITFCQIAYPLSRCGKQWFAYVLVGWQLLQSTAPARHTDTSPFRHCKWRHHFLAFFAIGVIWVHLDLEEDMVTTELGLGYKKKKFNPILLHMVPLITSVGGDEC